MKKNLLAVLSLTALCVGLVACDDPTASTSTPSGDVSNPTSENTSAPTTSDGRTKVEYWYRDSSSQSGLLATWEAEFEALHPDIDIVCTAQDGNYTVIAQSVVAGLAVNNYPNMVQAYADGVATFIQANPDVVVDLTSYIAAMSEEDRDDIIGITDRDDYAIEGTYSLPYFSSTEVMYYNASVLIGLTLDGINGGRAINEEYMNNLTWDELDRLADAVYAHDASVAEAEKLIKTELGYYSLLDWESADNLFITLCYSKDVPYSEIIDGVGTATMFNSAETKAMAKKLGQDALDKTITTMWDETYSSDLLFNQRCLLNINSTTGAAWLGTTNLDIGVAPIPHEEGEERKVMSQGADVCILDRGQAANDATWLWYEFMTSKENAVEWCTTTSYLPFRTSTYSDPTYVAARSETTPVRGETAYIVNRVSQVVEDYTESEYFTAPAYASSTGKSSSLRSAADAIAISAITNTEPVTDELVQSWFDAALIIANQ